MAATKAKTVSARQHKGWNWTGTWTLVFSYKLPTTRSTAHLSCFSFSHLSTVAPLQFRVLYTLADGPTSQP